MTKSFEDILRELEPKETGATEPYPGWKSRLEELERGHPPLVPYAIKGRASLLQRYASMRHNYAVSVDGAKGSYGGLPFGPRTKEAYNAGMASATGSYREKLITSHEKKWAARWIEGVTR